MELKLNGNIIGVVSNDFKEDNVNGKVRDTVKVFKDISKEDLEKEALNSDIIKKWLEGKEVVKIITIPGRIVNIVIR